MGRVVDLLWDACQNGRRLVLCGNGGSAATASHLVCDFQKNVYLEGGLPWEVVALTDSPSLITAWSNDTEYANVFAGQARVAAPGRRADRHLRLGQLAQRAARGRSGQRGRRHQRRLVRLRRGRLAQIARVNCVVHSRNMQMVEDLHMVLGHVVYSALRDRIKGLL